MSSVENGERLEEFIYVNNQSITEVGIYRAVNGSGTRCYEKALAISNCNLWNESTL